MKTTNRRDFLKAGAGTAVAVGSSLSLAGCAGSAGERSAASRPPSKVSAIRGTNLEAMTRDAIDALGGMKTVVQEGETVFIKPNLLTFPFAGEKQCFHLGECVKPEIIIAVMEECLKAGAGKVVIGDASQKPKFDWGYADTLDGEKNLVYEAKRLSAHYKKEIILACLDVDSPGWVELPSKIPQGKIAISSLMANADKVISLAVAKVHCWAQVTLAMKNFLGVTPLSHYGYGKQVSPGFWNRVAFSHRTPEILAQHYLDIVKAKHVDLSIVDFSIGLEAGGPSIKNGGVPLDMEERLGSWAVIAGRDILAVDATATRIMSHDVMKMKQLTMAYEMGLGEMREEKIELVGEKLDNLRVPWKPAPLLGGPRRKSAKKG